MVLLKLTSIESVMPSSHLILCRPLLLPPSVFQCESFLHIRWPKYWSFSFSISPSNEYSGLISFRIDWLDLLAVQGTLKSLFQHYSSKASVLRQSRGAPFRLYSEFCTRSTWRHLEGWQTRQGLGSRPDTHNSRNTLGHSLLGGIPAEYCALSQAEGARE